MHIRQKLKAHSRSQALKPTTLASQNYDYEVKIPAPENGKNSIFSAKNFAILFIVVVLVYLIIVLL